MKVVSHGEAEGVLLRMREAERGRSSNKQKGNCGAKEANQDTKHHENGVKAGPKSMNMNTECFVWPLGRESVPEAPTRSSGCDVFLHLENY